MVSVWSVLLSNKGNVLENQCTIGRKGLIPPFQLLIVWSLMIQKVRKIQDKEEGLKSWNALSDSITCCTY